MNIYRKALRLAVKDKKSRIAHGESGLLPVFDESAASSSIAYRETLGTVDIPAELIIGTVTESRSPAFSGGFYPLMAEGSEFSMKWTALCDAHLNESIRDPIRAVEYKNKFYVVEGHKRVSVLKYFGAVSIPGAVTRMVPVRTEDEDIRIYYEFLDFYRITGINYLLFSRLGGYADLLKVMEKQPDEPWSADDLHAFHSLYTMFDHAYLRRGGRQEQAAEALLAYLDIFGFQESQHKLPADLDADLAHMGVNLADKAERTVTLVMNDEAKKPILHLPSEYLTAAFLHEASTRASGWAYSHEIGRRDLEASLGDQVSTMSFDSLDTPQKAAEAIEQAVSTGANVIFTTSSMLLPESTKAAIRYPHVKFLNCSLGMKGPSVRTYYARTYETQYLLGAVAGALTPNDRITYIADCPIYGVTADINAFALGAQLVNPRARVNLEWSQSRVISSRSRLSDAGVTYVASIDRLSPYEAPTRQAGLYLSGGEHNVALSLCNWGVIYTKIIRRILDGSWKNDARGSSTVNYWWGLNSRAVQVVLSRSIPRGTQQLVAMLQDALRAGKLQPFFGEIRTQDGGTLHAFAPLPAEELAAMDWLAGNIVGSFPHREDLTDSARELMEMQESRGSL